MNILKGTFRLSIVATIIAGGWNAYSRYEQHIAAYVKQSELVRTLKCGARVDAERLKSTVNQFGLYDLSKVGCSFDRFLANDKELAEAASGTMDDMANNVYPPMFDLQDDLIFAGFVFVVVNLLGLAAVGLRAVWLWVIGGFRRDAE